MNNTLKDMISYFKRSLKCFNFIHNEISEKDLDEYIKKSYFNMFPQDMEINEDHFDIWLDLFLEKNF